MRHLVPRHASLAVAALTAVLGLTGFDAPAARLQAQAQPAGHVVDPSLFKGLRWRSIGPNRGGRSTAVAGSAARPLEYYFGATGGGLWKTTDGGETWHPVTDKFFAMSSVGAVAVAPSNPDVVYAGMGETELRGNIMQGDGVYKSTDAGKTWTHVGLEKTQAIARIRIDPTNPDIVYVAALGNPYGPNPDRGVFKSTDGGKAWQRVLFRDERTGAVDLAMDPKDPHVLYAGLWEVYRTPSSLSSGGPGSGLFKSTDGGATWTELTKNPGLPAPIWGKVGVSVSGADSNRVYAIVEAKAGGLFASDDGGATWRLANDSRDIRQRAFYYTRVYADPQAKDTVYVLNTSIYRSTDAGKTLKRVRDPHGDNHDLWIAPNDPRRMINSNDGGANVSVNAGESWTRQDFPTAQLYNAFTTANVPFDVCGAQQDNSTVCVPVTGNGDDFYDVGGGESGYIAPDPLDVDVYYAGSYGGLLTRLNRRTGNVRAINVWPDNPMGHNSGDMTERFQWTYPIVIAPTDPHTLYVTSQHVWKTTNEGQTWERISPDLTRHDPKTMGDSGGPITLDQSGVETYATIFALAPSPVDGSVIWAGSDDGLVNVTRDGGQHWTAVTPPDLPPFARISRIDASPHDAGVAYVAANRYEQSDRAPYVYRTHDFGQTWTKIVNGVAPGDFARVVCEDPKRQGLLWLGTENGIYISFDDGTDWQPFRLDLPATQVPGIVVDGDELVIATHGRSFYVLDNISMLRQITPDTTTKPVVLFEPGDAMRSVSRGVAIDYYLAQAADKVTIDILDGQGQVVRSFTGVPSKEPEKPAAPPSEEDFFRPPAPKVPVGQGMNRFTWDGRYAGAHDFKGLILWAGSTRGPQAPPGPYQVRLTASGQTFTQRFAIVRDPLMKATDADLREQFTLARQISDKVSAANDAVVRVRALKDQIADRLGKTKDASIARAGDALTQKLTAIEGEIYQYRNRSGEDPLNFPIRLNNELAALESVVEAGDNAPTDQDYAVFKDLSQKLDTQLARIDAVVKGDVAAFNAQLKKKKLPPIA
ncbi:MAG TPA: hypothetical protein VFX12_00980 [Vicinamibacterales bacterium]|nr:hypothetical protein [Vicinamibacterales bacterium]